MVQNHIENKHAAYDAILQRYQYIVPPVCSLLTMFSFLRHCQRGRSPTQCRARPGIAARPAAAPASSATRRTCSFDARRADWPWTASHQQAETVLLLDNGTCHAVTVQTTDAVNLVDGTVEYELRLGVHVNRDR
ncbi:hypothetical protein CALVIDRAFT_290337 [Calocera viscosa TUFC12733]|uniref:Uncharacterized protein n=1 Tax=Calocera viscosa (strain TUFC12733) TaxID=1330018 RepID=A0A167IRB3_CALVF|nr:hypothetical protein CALVIDRAFT_290337 [Calocera viscosa TUFC12733]